MQAGAGRCIEALGLQHCNGSIATLQALGHWGCNMATVRYNIATAWARMGVASSHLLTARCRIPLPLSGMLFCDLALPSDFGAQSSGIVWPFGIDKFLRRSFKLSHVKTPFQIKKSAICRLKVTDTSR